MYKFEYKTILDVTEIYVKRRSGIVFTVLIDTEDLPKLQGYSVGINDKPNGRFMIRVTNGYRTEQAITNILTSCPSGFIIDHEDRNPANNRKSNFRPLTIAENNQNQSMLATNTSGIKGVCFDKARNKWFVQIRKKTIGRFDHFADAVQAATAYREKFLPLSL